MIGKIHSIETYGTVDGPGIRFIIFFQGCPLRCMYCHNPDTWKLSDGKDYPLDDLVKEILKYQSYMKYSGGGVTASGGEPCVQSEFVLELFKRLKKEGINTALDTSGNILNDTVKQLIEFTDLVLLDIKSFEDKNYKMLTSQELSKTLEFAKYLSENNKDIWIRYVLVPTITDDIKSIEALADFVYNLGIVKMVEVLPFHKMGEYKWETLKYEYKLKDVEPPSSELLEQVKEIFRSKGLNVH